MVYAVSSVPIIASSGRSCQGPQPDFFGAGCLRSGFAVAPLVADRHTRDVLGPDALLAAYDDQLRDTAEAIGATDTTRIGPLLLVTFPGDRGLVTYRALAVRRRELRPLVLAALAHFEVDPRIRHVEWKTRGHDRINGLGDELIANGFVPQPAESIMLGEARSLTEPVALPADVTVRRATEEGLVRAACAVADEVFAEPVSEDRAGALWQRVSGGDSTQVWVAEAHGQVVSTGRLDLVPDSTFAGIWGGATVASWRGRGLYRALVRARAEAALQLGRSLIHSDSTRLSRPILERAGLLRVSTTTPYVWTR